jgi:predicted phage terminase large subunit-like protein
MLTSSELHSLELLLPQLPDKDKVEVLIALEELERREELKRARESLLVFTQRLNPAYKVGTMHRNLAKALEDLAEGRKERVAVNCPPRFGKSLLTSVNFPAWYIGRHPDRQLMLVSHTADLAIDFGRKVRNIVASAEFQEVFPGVSLAQDSKSAGRWNTSRGGAFFAVGVGGAIAGRGADLLVIDDPHNEQDILNGNLDVFDKAYDWYTFGARTRLMPNASVALVMTRWSTADLTGRLVQDMVRKPDADQWHLVEFPALLEKKREKPPEGDEGDEGDEGEGETSTGVEYVSLWPEQWPVEALLRTRASMPPFQWNAQYQQSPTASEASIIKREWWRKWEKDEPPECEYVIMSLDAAAERKNRSDYTSLTTWGVFQMDNEQGLPQNHIILLNAIKDRWEFPTLKRRALEEYQRWTPDWFVVEKKSSGTPLFQELRAIGVPVQEYTPHRGTGDKVVRLNSVSDIFSSGLVWYPVGRRWAEDLVEEVCGFPAMQYDDQVDSTVQALIRFRTGGFLSLPSDAFADDDFVPKRAAYY